MNILAALGGVIVGAVVAAIIGAALGAAIYGGINLLCVAFHGTGFWQAGPWDQVLQRGAMCGGIGGGVGGFVGVSLGIARYGA